MNDNTRRRPGFFVCHDICCSVCLNKRYLVSTRGDGRQAVERCDTCSVGVLTDTMAAVLARSDGVRCARSYPCYIEEAHNETT